MADQPEAAPQADSKNDAPDTTPDQEKNSGRSFVFWIALVIGGVIGLFMISLIAALVLALAGDPADVANWVGIFRDLFIILLAMEGIIMGMALIVLVIQLAALLNILQNEVKPIVDNANETVTTVRGTAQFMSQNMVEPVVKTSAFIAGVSGMLREVMGIRRALKPTTPKEPSDQSRKNGKNPPDNTSDAGKQPDTAKS